MGRSAMIVLATLLATSSSTTTTTASNKPAIGRPPLAQPAPPPARCPPEMTLVDDRFCIDKFEASTVEIRDDGRTTPHSPFLPVTGMRVKAVSAKSVVPQAYISRNEADAACRESGKRLCDNREWIAACKGPQETRYPYGNARKAGYCVDTNRVAPLSKLFEGLGSKRYREGPMNDPRLNQIPGTLAPTGSFAQCTNSFHVYDMVGNVHEWTSDPEGTFRGGYYLDTKINGEGCDYRTVAHPGSYHDYSTGFRCCQDAAH
ncbi:MAG TPA: SUMF1/EgtB/PvdO family nonheme iron enzyme [Polyangiaceae bacterium]|nr:SUMF1/EgtB/PvdO family nonheme iron enzyme [Polyangiaceae bacterium]